MPSKEFEWVSFQADQGAGNIINLCIMYFEKNEHYEFYVTDLSKVWRERIKKHSQTFEGSLRSHVKNFNPKEENTVLGELFDMVREKSTVKTFIDVEDMVSVDPNVHFKNLELKRKSGKISIYIKLRLKEMRPDGFLATVTTPPLLLLKQAEEKEKYLISQLQKKDEEIEEYVAGGAKLTRIILKTPKFDVESFHKDFQPVASADVETKTATELLASVAGLDQVCAKMLALNLLGKQRSKNADSTPETSPVNSRPSSRPTSPAPQPSTQVSQPPTQVPQSSTQPSSPKKIKMVEKMPSQPPTVTKFNLKKRFL